MADDLRDSITEAIETETKDDSVENKVEPVVSETVIETTEVSPPEVVTPASDTPAPVETTPQEPTVEVAPAPASWKGEAKQVWADLPEKARNEVLRREANINRVLAENAEVRNFATPMHEVTQRHSERITEWGLPPAQVFDMLLEADRMLSTAEPVSRAQYMAKLIKDYGVDIRALDDALSGATPAVPDVSRQVQMQVDAALAPFRKYQQEEQQSQQQAVQDGIDSMTDNPNYPQFEDVREEMADLIEIKAKRGLYLSLDEAYSLATGRSQQQVAAVKQNNATAQKAKAAAVSVSGTPASSTGGADPNDLRGTISSILDGIR